MMESLTDLDPAKVDSANPIIRRCLRDPHITKQFDIISQLGEGGYGTVLKVRLKTDRKIYALKLIPIETNENKDKLLREAELLSSLQHKHIVRYYTSWMMGSTFDSDEEEDLEEEDMDEEAKDDDNEKGNKDDNSISFCESSTEFPEVEKAKISAMFDDEMDFISESVEKLSITGSEDNNNSEQGEILCIKMEFCARTLRNYLKTERGRTVNDIENILSEIVAGLSYIHQKGIMHRDIKPDNIFFDEENHVKIGDFGLSCVENTDSDVGLTDESVTVDTYDVTRPVGTSLYMAPEIRETDTKIYGKNVDWFSVGVILLELCYVFETGSHRVEVLSKLGISKTVELPKDFDTKGIGVEHFRNKILTLLDHSPDVRLSAVQTRRQNMELTWYETNGFCSVCKLDLVSHDVIKDHIDSREHADAKVSWITDHKGQGHTQHWCAVCQITCSGIESLITHATGKQHKSKIQEKKNYYCDICNCYTTGSKNFDQHLASKRHQKEATLKEKGLADKKFSCDVCNIQCSGPENLEQHCRSKSHKKHVDMPNESDNTFYCEQCNIKCTGKECLEQHKRSKRHRKSTGEKHDLQEKDKYYCDTCHISCTGPETFKQHTESKKHEKELASKLGLSDAIPVLLCQTCNIPCTSLKNLEEHFSSKSHKKLVEERQSVATKFHCDVCDIDCTGKECFDQHVQGQGHMKAVLRAKRMSHGSGSDYHCKVCELSCTGPENFKQHLESEKHIKKASLLDDINEKQRISNESVLDYYCIICELSCTGPENFKQHVEGEKHIKRANLQGDKNEKEWFCDVCDIKCSGQENYKQHCEGKNHAKQLSRLESVNKFHCKMCDFECSGKDNFDQHFLTEEHLNVLKK